MYRDYRAALNQDQRLLEMAMSAVSEDAYCAGWMDTTDREVWRLINQGGEWGMGVYALDDDLLEAVRRAMVTADCWISWPDPIMGDMQAIPLDEWRASLGIKP